MKNDPQWCAERQALIARYVQAMRAATHPGERLYFDLMSQVAHVVTDWMDDLPVTEKPEHIIQAVTSVSAAILADTLSSLIEPGSVIDTVAAGQEFGERLLLMFENVDHSAQDTKADA